MDALILCSLYKYNYNSMSLRVETLDMTKLPHKTPRITANYFPEEIFNEILLRLPVKSIIKCSAVCKSWKALIISRTFIHTHLNRQNDDVHLLLRMVVPKEADVPSYSLHWDNPAFGEYTKLVTLSYNNRPIPHYFVIGTCNGLVCLVAYSSIVIWNPSIRKYGVLPTRPTVTKSLGRYVFCYDSRVNDYMVLRIASASLNMETPCEALEFWSLAKGSWNSVSAIPANFRPRSYAHAFVKGAVHWVQSIDEVEDGDGDYDTDDYTSSIVTFDMVNESFGEVPLRKAKGGLPPYIARYGEFLAVFEFLSPFAFDMWVMTEYGVAKSWTKLFTFSEVEECFIQPYGFRKSGEVVILREEMLISVDPKSKEVKDLGIDDRYEHYHLNSFVESLVLLDEPNTTSY